MENQTYDIDFDTNCWIKNLLLDLKL